MSSPSSLASANARRRPPKMKPKTATLVLVCLCSLALNAFQRHLATKRVGGSGHKEPDQTYQDDLARWRDYAASMNASMYEADYRQIFDDLQRWQQLGGINGSMVRRAHERFNRVHLFTLSSEGVSVKLRVNDKLTTRRADWYRKMLQELHPSLPPGLNVTLPINMFDEPLSWVTPLPSFDEAALHNGTLTLKEAWFKHACDAVGLSQYRTLHGAFLDPPAMEFDHELLPILSPYTLPGCFADILIPHIGSYHAGWDTVRGCPFDAKKWEQYWEQRQNSAIFRGSSTGGWVYHDTPPEVYSRMHRQRLVGLSQSLKARGRRDIDAAITAWVQCSKSRCIEQAERYGVANRTNPFKYRYNIVVDGNGAPDRLALTMCAGSVVLKGTLFKEWYYESLRPYVHYLPIQLDYSDLVAQLDWAKANQDKVKEIAAAAAQFVDSRLRDGHMKAYWFRLLVEWQRLYRPDQ